MIMEAIPLNAAAPEASKLEAAQALEAMAVIVGATSEAGTSSGREMVLVPSARIEPSVGIRVLPEEVQTTRNHLISDENKLSQIAEKPS